jgi:hypothetical protein
MQRTQRVLNSFKKPLRNPFPSLPTSQKNFYLDKKKPYSHNRPNFFIRLPNSTNHPKERLKRSANPVLQEGRADSREWLSEVPEERLIALNSDFSQGGILYYRGMKVRKK